MKLDFFVTAKETVRYNLLCLVTTPNLAAMRFAVVNRASVISRLTARAASNTGIFSFQRTWKVEFGSRHLDFKWSGKVGLIETWKDDRTNIEMNVNV